MMRHKKCYFLLSELESLPGSDTLDTIFNNCHWFDGTLSYTDSEGNLHSYKNLGFTPNQLLGYWVEMYGYRRIGLPLRGNPWCLTQTELTQEVQNLCNSLKVRAEMFMLANKEKFLGLMRTLDFEYNPISNYDMIEKEGESKKVAAEEQIDSYLGGNKTTSSNIVTNRQDDFTTSFETGAEGSTRLAARRETSGLDGRGNQVAPTQTETDTTERKIITGFSQEEVSFSQSGDYMGTPNADEASTRVLTRSGNIGVTTTQEMIKSERDIQNFNIIEQFFTELNKFLLLDVWG